MKNSDLDYKGSIKFSDDPNYHDLYISKEGDTIEIALSAEDLLADSGNEEYKFLSKEDTRYEAILDTLVGNNKTTATSYNFEDFHHEKTGLSFRYRPDNSNFQNLLNPSNYDLTRKNNYFYRPKSFSNLSNLDSNINSVPKNINNKNKNILR